MNIDKINAIKSLSPDAEVSQIGDDIIWHNPSEPTVTEVEIDTEVKRLQEVWDSQAYARERAEQYPDLKEQLDLIWHAIDNDELTKSVNNKFYTMLKKVKDDNPKG